MADLLTLMLDRGYSPRKTSTKDGGEYSSPCPVCGDGGKGARSDRFHIWPSRETSGKGTGRFWCRQCGISGDSIAFLQKVDALSFVDACNELGIVLQQQGNLFRARRYQPPPQPAQEPQSWQPTAYPEPCETWQLKATNLLAECQARLMGDQAAMEWLAQRGITRDMAARYGLGYNRSSKGGDRYRPRTSWGLQEKLQDGKKKKLWLPQGWVLPARNASGELVQLRIRRRPEDIARFGGHIKYLPIDGSSPATLVLHPEAEVFVMVESGFEAVLIAGLFEGKVGTMTTWNSSARPDRYAHALLSSCPCILGGLDYDQGGDREQEWWSNTYPQYRRLPALPGGAKDPGDAFADGHTDHAALRGWVIDGLPRGLRIKLGFERGYCAPARPEKQTRKKQAKPDKNSTQRPKVAELQLTNGATIYVTDDRPQWRSLMDAGKPAFSTNELQRLKRGAGVVDEHESSVLVAMKEVLGGYIRAGREART